MIPDVSEALSWLEAHPTSLTGILRGIERETLRVTAEGKLAATEHPRILGSALTHKWITTDFAEALLEFITPVDNDIEHMLMFLQDLHRYAARNLADERMWPFSMPCFINAEQEITLAQYGVSNIGRMKTLYREGLKNRYGALMQTISGVHYNFSLPLKFWQEWLGITDASSGKELISSAYFRLIRNYYRFGWVIPYLFGASPAICSSFIKSRNTTLPFKDGPNGMLYLPYATSLRLSDLGYTNRSQNNLSITFNNLADYVVGLKNAIATPSEEFAKIGLGQHGHELQLNTNILQIENELYAPIRPKRVISGSERSSDALLRDGVEYIEIRALDVNPFSPIGIDANQVRFLDLFLIWCVLAQAPEMSSDELLCARKNWDRVVLEGRKPGQTIRFGCGESYAPLVEVGKALFVDLQRIAQVLDSQNKDNAYQRVCNELTTMFEQPSQTFSARLLEMMLQEGASCVGVSLAQQYREMLIKEPFALLKQQDFVAEQQRSWQRQKILENEDRLSFEAFLQQQGIR